MLDMRFLTKVGKMDSAGAMRWWRREGKRRTCADWRDCMPMMELVGEAKGRLLRYEQWKDRGGSGVTLGAVGLYG